MVLHWAVAVTAVARAAAGSGALPPLPSVYWASSPTLANETFVVAGAFGALPGASLGLCCGDTPTCRNVTARVWAQSIQVVLPADIRPPCALQLAHNDANLVRRESVAVNAPDVWWWQSGAPDRASRQPGAVVRGDPLRVFGRSLAWTPDSTECISAARQPAAGTSTVLSLVSTGSNPAARVPAAAAGCYEASFATDGVTPGEYAATVTSPWGASPQFAVTVAPAPAEAPPVTVDVNADHGGNVTAALAAAAAAASANSRSRIRVVLGPREYALDAPLSLPNRTALVGRGATTSVLAFSIAPPPPPPPAVCTPPRLVDFYASNCTPGRPGCFREVGVDRNAGSSAGCCAACAVNPGCNAYTFIGGINPPNGSCGLRFCPDRACASTPSRRGSMNRTSAWLSGSHTPPAVQAAVVAAGESSSLTDLGVVVRATPGPIPAVWATNTSRGFAAVGVSVRLEQPVVSNGFWIESRGFRVAQATVSQLGACPATGFQSNVALYLLNASLGVVTGCTVRWNCSAFDLDVSDRVVVENNTFECVNRGVLPHGNSVSGYQWRTRPVSENYLFARNAFSRPPFTPGTEQNWNQRETLTTDGSGAYGVGTVAAARSTSVTLRWQAWVSPPEVGCLLVVLGGAGAGQHRTVVGVGPANGTLVLDAPLDGWVAPGGGSSSSGGSDSSVVAVTSRFGSKLFVGNRFNWTEVVQWYGATVRGVMADNEVHNANVLFGQRHRATIGGVGECYHGSAPVLYTEFSGNAMVDSDGIGLRDSKAPANGPCSAYRGPWVRFSVMRRNSVAGISLASRNASAQAGGSPACGSVFLFNPTPDTPTTDVVAEHNDFDCPPPGNRSTSGHHVLDGDACSHCAVRP